MLLLTCAPLSARAQSTPGGAPRPAGEAAKECSDAYVAGQQLRKDGRWLSARDRFNACVRDVCPGWAQRRCAEWLTELAREVPSLLLGARDSAGRDLPDVTITIDGVARQDSRPGIPIPLDPGGHTLRFEAAGMLPVERAVVLVAGENRPVIVTLEPTTPDRPPVPVPESPRPESPSPTPPVLFWALGGVGIATGAVSGYLLARAAQDRASSGCDVRCSSSDLDRVRGKFIVADVGLGASVAALAGAAWVFFSWRGERNHARKIVVQPILSTVGVGLSAVFPIDG